MLSMDLDIYSLHLWFNNDETASLVLPTWVLVVIAGIVIFRKVRKSR